MKGFNAPSGSAHEDIDFNNYTMRQRARMLYMAAPIATSAIKTNRTNVVGVGLRLKSRIDREVLGLSPDQAERWQKETEREFSLWASNKRPRNDQPEKDRRRKRGSYGDVPDAGLYRLHDQRLPSDRHLRGAGSILANVCLNELDQYIKHELKAHFYDRYMDDMALLYPDAATLNRWRAAIEKYLNEVLHLELNSKTTIGLVKRGITFVGCRIYPGYRKPTAQSVKKMKARMRYIAKEYEAGLIDFDAVDATMQSYFGLMGHCSTHGLQKWIEKNIIFKRKEMADIELPQEVTQWELNQF